MGTTPPRRKIVLVGEARHPQLPGMAPLIVLQTLGTRGDVQPFLALGQGLRANGFAVRLATAPRFAEAARAEGLDFAPLPGEMIDLLDTPEGRAAIGGRHPLLGKLRLLRGLAPMFDRLLAAQWQAAQGAALLVAHPKALGGMPIAERLGIPGFRALPLPALAPTAAFPTPLLPFADLGPMNRASHRVMLALGDWLARGPLRRFRAGLGLAPAGGSHLLRGRPAPVLLAMSPSLVPPPPDWADDVFVTGDWVLPDPPGWRPPGALEAFLAAGPPPVHIGFGSLPSPDPVGLTRLVGAALSIAGQRGVIATGWGGLAPPPQAPELFGLEAAPHGWLLPRMVAVVHHGGAGTTHAGLRAGRPSLLCPVFGDQPFWGRRVKSLGAGPTPIPLRKLTAPALAAAIREATGNPAMRRAAGRIAGAMAMEDGVAQATRILRAALRSPG